jgi:hypothetical protein
MTQSATHEDFLRKTEVRMGSDRTFGLIFTVVFVLFGLAPLRHGGELRLWAVGLSGVFLAAALFAPKVLRPMNRVWFKFGLLLHHIVNPLVMGLLFFLTVTPVAILMRWSGKDPLRLKSAPAVRSYWITRPPSGPASTTMKRQF